MIVRILDEIVLVKNSKEEGEQLRVPITPVAFEKDKFEHIEMIEAMASLYAGTQSKFYQRITTDKNAIRFQRYQLIK